MLSAFKAKLRAAREESRGRADSVADAEDLGSGGGAGVEEEEGCGWYVCYVDWCNLLQWNISIQDTLNRGHLSYEDTVCCPNYTVYKTTSKLGTPLYTGQPAGSRWCPL